jgi:hypothetical protein
MGLDGGEKNHHKCDAFCFKEMFFSSEYERTTIMRILEQGT